MSEVTDGPQIKLPESCGEEGAQEHAGHGGRAPGGPEADEEEDGEVSLKEQLLGHGFGFYREPHWDWGAWFGFGALQVSHGSVTLCFFKKRIDGITEPYSRVWLTLRKWKAELVCL